MPPVQSALAQVGVATQAVKGTGTANPTFTHGVTDGAVFSVDVEQDRTDLTSGTRVSPQVDRTGIKAGFDLTTRAFLKTIGLWLYLALGGKSVSGAGPYVHIFTGANTLPYGTFWGWLDSTIYKFRDAMVDEIEISWEGTGPVEVKVKGMGTAIDWAGTFTAGTDENRAEYYRAAGGTFKYDVDSATSVVGKITGGSIKVTNNLKDRTLSASVVPDEWFPGRRDVDWSLKVIPDDILDLRTIVTGTAGGTTARETVLYGAAEVTFTNGSDSLKFESLRVAYTTEFPDADPGGGPVELALSGLAVTPTAGGAELTATLTNTQATY